MHKIFPKKGTNPSEIIEIPVLQAKTLPRICKLKKGT
jgi:hypothetical protein